MTPTLGNLSPELLQAYLSAIGQDSGAGNSQTPPVSSPTASQNSGPSSTPDIPEIPLPPGVASQLSPGSSPSAQASAQTQAPSSATPSNIPAVDTSKPRYTMPNYQQLMDMMNQMSPEEKKAIAAIEKPPEQRAKELQQQYWNVPAPLKILRGIQEAVRFGLNPVQYEPLSTHFRNVAEKQYEAETGAQGRILQDIMAGKRLAASTMLGQERVNVSANKELDQKADIDSKMMARQKGTDIRQQIADNQADRNQIMKDLNDQKIPLYIAQAKLANNNADWQNLKLSYAKELGAPPDAIRGPEAFASYLASQEAKGGTSAIQAQKMRQQYQQLEIMRAAEHPQLVTVPNAAGGTSIIDKRNPQAGAVSAGPNPVGTGDDELDKLVASTKPLQGQSELVRSSAEAQAKALTDIFSQLDTLEKKGGFNFGKLPAFISNGPLGPYANDPDVNALLNTLKSTTLFGSSAHGLRSAKASDILADKLGKQAMSTSAAGAKTALMPYIKASVERLQSLGPAAIPTLTRMGYPPEEIRALLKIAKQK